MPVDRDVLEEMHRRLGDRLSELTAGQDWLDWLASARHFHRYSPQNQMLLALQGAHGHVASYRTWQRLPAQDGARCQVARGEKGLTILAPLTVTRRETDEVTGDEVVVAAGLRGFKAVKVFHQGQLVSPPDLPDRPLPQLLTGDNRHQHVWSAVQSHLEDLGYDVDIVTRAPAEAWNGRTDFTASQVVVSDHLEPPARLKTLIHEWAHVALDHDDRIGLRRDLQEVEAESAAFLVCAAVGVDSARYSVPYLASWADGDRELLQDTAQRVLATTHRMIDTLEAELSIDLTPDLVAHAATPVTNLTAVDDVERPRPFVTQTADSPLLDDVGTHTVIARLVDEADRQRFLDGVAALDDQLGVVAGLCADAGLDAEQTKTFLARLGAEPDAVRQAMTAPVVDSLGEQPNEPLFPEDPEPDQPAPSPTLPAASGRPLPGAVTRLGADDRQVLERMCLTNPADRNSAARFLAEAGTDLADAAEVLGFYGLDDTAVVETLQYRHYDPATGEYTALWATDPPAINDSATTSAAANAPEPAHQTAPADDDVRAAAPAHDVVRDVAGSGDPQRLAALSDALGHDHADAVGLWAKAGVSAELAAAAAIQRRHGDVDAALTDLTAAWTDGPPIEWDKHLPPPAAPPPSTAHAILNSWAAQRGTKPAPPAREMA